MAVEGEPRQQGKLSVHAVLFTDAAVVSSALPHAMPGRIIDKTRTLIGPWLMKKKIAGATYEQEEKRKEHLARLVSPRGLNGRR